MNKFKQLLFLRYRLDHLLYIMSNPINKFTSAKIDHNTDKILIVCNGPSLKKTPLDDFKNEFSIGLNKIHLIFEQTEWRPNIIVSSNKFVLQQTSFTDKNINYFFPWQQRYFINNAFKPKFFSVLNKHGFSTRPDCYLSIAYTVTYYALQIAAYYHPKLICIVGLDHNFSSQGSANKVVKAGSKDPDHFVDNYFTNCKWNLPDLNKSELHFQEAKNYFDSNNIPIYDATIGGKLRIFDKITVDHALELFRE